MMQLTQAQLVQIVSSAVSQALTQHVQQTANNPPLAAAASTSSIYPYSRVIVEQVGWRGVRELYTRPKRVALKLN